MFRNLTIRNKIKIPLAMLVGLLAVFTFLRIQDYQEAKAQMSEFALSASRTIDAVSLIEEISGDFRELASKIEEESGGETALELQRQGAELILSSRSRMDQIGIDERLRRQIADGINRLARRLEEVDASIARLRARRATLDERRDRLSIQVDAMDLANAGIMSTVLVDARENYVSRGDGRSVDVLLGDIEPAIRFRVELSELLALLREMIAVEDGTRRALLVSTVEDKLSAAVLTLARLPDAASQRLMPPLRSLREIALGPDGFASAAIELENALNIFQGAVVRLASAAETELVDLSDITEANELGTAAYLSEQQNTALSSALFEIFLTFVVGVTVVTAVWWLFSSQVSRRIEYLTDDMLAIAHGDLGREPSIGGTDEIGRMGDALEVFKQNAQELRRSNEDLENFAYVASHDLRSPLWAIRDLAEWTMEDHGKELSDPVRHNLALILARVQRLAQLLADLLDYARAGEVSRKRIALNLEQMTREIDDLLGADGFNIDFVGEPVLVSAPAPIRTILLNLVSNAIKHHDMEEGTITVESHVRAGASVIEVIDDGPGIPTKYQSKIFELFQTLELKDKHESSGLGLAMARKLAEQIGGTLTVHSNPDEGRGTTFTLIIPVDARRVAEALGGARIPDGEAA